MNASRHAALAIALLTPELADSMLATDNSIHDYFNLPSECDDATIANAILNCLLDSDDSIMTSLELCAPSTIAAITPLFDPAELNDLSTRDLFTDLSDDDFALTTALLIPIFRMMLDI